MSQVFLYDIINLAKDQRLHPQPVAPGSEEMRPVQLLLHYHDADGRAVYALFDKVSLKVVDGRNAVLLSLPRGMRLESVKPEPVPEKVASRAEPPTPGSEGTP